MTFLIVAMVFVAAFAAVATYVAHRTPSRSSRRELPLLVFAMPPRIERSETVPESAEPEEPIVTTSDEVPDRTRPLANDTVQFRRPAEEALQLLPGRLEVLSGLELPREIRLVRVPGERPGMILGREPGGSPQHVALPSSTVSRQHARLDFSGGRWELTNLSRTNPVVVNDETLSGVRGERVLVDGDRIELGDVVLRFFTH